MCLKMFTFAFNFAICCQIAMTQRPSVIPNPLGINPLGANPLPNFVSNPLNPLGGSAISPPFFGGFSSNWVRPYYTAAVDGWQTYFEQLQQARNQLFNTLTNIPSSAQNATGAARDTVNHIFSVFPSNTIHANDGDKILGESLSPPTVEVPVQHQVQETQIVTTVTRPHGEVQQVRPQGQVTVSQGQTAPRQPQPVQTLTAANKSISSAFTTTNNRPITTANGLPQVLPPVETQFVPQITNPVPNWIGK